MPNQKNEKQPVSDTEIYKESTTSTINESLKSTLYTEATYKVIRRNGNIIPFDRSRIEIALTKAFLSVEGGIAASSSRVHDIVRKITEQVVHNLFKRMPDGGIVHIEEIQDQVEIELMRSDVRKVARAYILYREERAHIRDKKVKQSDRELKTVTVGRDDENEMYNVWIDSFKNVVEAIKSIRKITGFDLSSSKKLIESTPAIIAKGLSKKRAKEIVNKFQSPSIKLKILEDIEKKSVEETQLDLLVCQTMGFNPDHFPLLRVIPVNIYLASGNNSDNILTSLHEFLNSFGLEQTGESPAIISSFYKRLWVRSTSKETLDELKNKLTKMEQALEAQQIDKPKSEIDLNHATAAEKLLNALGNDSKSTALHVGNLLILVLVDENGDKHNRVITLTKDQIEMIQKDQNLLRKPELLLQHLNTKNIIANEK